MHRNHKPARECHRCPLNLGDRCPAFEYPHDQWEHHRHCPGYMNEELRQEYDRHLVGRPAGQAVQRRRRVAGVQRTRDHRQGNRDPRTHGAVL